MTAKSHTINNKICRIFTTWAKDNQGSPNFENSKYLGYMYLNMAYHAYYSVYVLMRILSGKVDDSKRHFRLNMTFEYIILAQFDPKRIDSFLAEYQNK